MAQISNGHGIVAVNGDYAIAYDVTGQHEVGKLAIPCTEKDGREFIAKHMHPNSELYPIGVTATAFLKKDMKAT